jgi:hypothetical protein
MSPSASKKSCGGRQSFLTDQLKPWAGDENAALLTDGKSNEAGYPPQRPRGVRPGGHVPRDGRAVRAARRA